MKILAIDTTAVAASVALCEDGELLGEYTIRNGNTHSQTILPMVESLLSFFELTVDDIDLTELFGWAMQGRSVAVAVLHAPENPASNAISVMDRSVVTISSSARCSLRVTISLLRETPSFCCISRLR